MRLRGRLARARARWTLAAGACIALCLLAGAARAQPAPDDPPPEAYMALIEEAVDESAAEHWAEARSLFREAQRVYPNARALRGIGMTSFELRDYTSAYRALSAALAETRRALDAEQRAQVAALLARVNGLIGRYSLAHLGELRSIAVDGVRQDLGGGDEVLLTHGEHRVHVVLADGRQVTGTWVVSGGEHEPLPLELPSVDVTPERAAEAAPETPGAHHPLAPPETQTADTLDTPARRVAGALGLGAGAGIVVVGAALVTVGGRDLAELEHPEPGTPWSDVNQLRDRAPRFVRSGAVLLVAGTGLATAGLTLSLRAAVARGARDDDAPLDAARGASVRARLLPSAAELEVTW